MRTHSDSPPERLVRELKRWKIISAVLLALVVLLGSLSAWLMRAMDDEYSGLIDRSVPALSSLREIDNSVLSAHRALLAALLADDRQGREQALGRVAVLLDNARNLRETLPGKPIFTSPESLATLDKAGTDYEAATIQFVALARKDRLPEARAWRNTKVKPALDRYLMQLDIAAHYVADRSQKQSDDMTDVARSRSALLVGVASLPILVGSAALLAVAAVIVGMVLIFRRANAEDAQ